MRLLAGLALALCGCTGGPKDPTPTPTPPLPPTATTPAPGPTAAIGPPADTTGLVPLPFHFRNVDDADPGKRYTATVTLTGFVGEALATVEGATDAILDAEHFRRPPTGGLLVSAGQLRVSMAASPAALRLKTVTVHLDDLTSTWSIRTKTGALDVDSPTACVHGFCAASDAGECTAAPPLAELYCLYQGFEGATSFTTTLRTGADGRCRSDGSACTTLEPCGLVFATILCH